MAEGTSSESSGFNALLHELFTSPINLCLIAFIAYIVYKIYKNTYRQHSTHEPEPELPKMKKRDFTLEELKPYDGRGPDGRILVAVNGKVFDVTKGKRFYGPGASQFFAPKVSYPGGFQGSELTKCLGGMEAYAPPYLTIGRKISYSFIPLYLNFAHSIPLNIRGPYAAFGGRDASRGLATFSVTGGSDTYDDLSDLNSMEMDSVREWEMQFTDRYDYIGKLLKPGQEATNYSDEEEDTTQETVNEKPKED